jgi:FolB domain-containing protein
MSDRITISGLQCVGCVGTKEWEKKERQPILVDMVLQTDLKKAAKTDHLEDTIDYESLCSSVKQLTSSKHYHLIESLAEEIARMVLTEFKPKEVRLTVTKPHALLGVDKVGVTIERKRI